MRLTRSNGDRVDVNAARISGDSIIGVDESNRKFAIASSDVLSLQTRQLNGDRTAVAVVAGVLGAAVVFVVLVLLTGGVSIAPTF